MDDEFESGLDDFTVSLGLMVRDLSEGRTVIRKDPEKGSGFSVLGADGLVYGQATLVDGTYAAVLSNPVGDETPHTSYQNEAARIIYESLESRCENNS